MNEQIIPPLLPTNVVAHCAVGDETLQILLRPLVRAGIWYSATGDYVSPEVSEFRYAAQTAKLIFWEETRIV